MDKAVGYKTGTRTRQQDTKLAHGQGSRIQNWHTDKAAGYKTGTRTRQQDTKEYMDRHQTVADA